ncbi:cytochrome-c peroxidase [Aliiruegeria haliotis]|nr:cytochrome c peroxidase [Aliiruegeria haliotis]
MVAVTGAHASDLPAPLQADDFIAFDDRQAQIGQLLFFDPILSGNRNISCATCHHPDHGSADGLPLGIGEGGSGIGPRRTAGEGEDRIRKRIPRNAPALWNLGAKEVDVLFHDGRVSVSDIYGNGFNTPAQEWLPDGLNSLLAVQALFPMTSQFEMAGNPKENEVAGAVHDRIDNVWPIIAKRVRVIPEYAELFMAAFDDVDSPFDIDITHVVNAIAAFEGTEFQSFDSPFDAYLSGDSAALTARQHAGMELFYGKAGCSSCHSGSLLTDHGFHALALPHFGPGRTRQWDSIVRDVGHMAVSDRIDDAYRFRTPALRNVALTAPYGHNGAYRTLEAMVRHHLDPRAGFDGWTPQEVDLPDVPWLSQADFISMQDERERGRLASRIDITPVELTDAEIAEIIAFLHALTGTQSLKGRLGRPDNVPSGLEID